MGGSLGSNGFATDRVPAAFQTLYVPGNGVEVAATPLGLGVPGMQAYHTSIVVEGLEYSFSLSGVTYGQDLISHRHLPDGPPKVTYMGLTSITGKDMLRALRPHFQAGTYDLLKKNCNSFSDCALFYLLDVRLDPALRGLEQIGEAADRNAGVVQSLTGGEYVPNPKADRFNIEEVVRRIDTEKFSGVAQKDGGHRKQVPGGSCF
mmetsp:Transcript_31815/g.69581  ORF Transcript_31815/g.69581 Transcript_31815/m.69581 type:complete len:205 (-) Transcript_31815:136-750(-)